MNKTFIVLALLPLLGAGCFGSPAPDGEGPYTNEPTPAVSEVMPEEEGPPLLEEAEEPTAQPAVKAPKDSLLAETQKAGAEAVVKNVNLAKPGYVMIHEVADGKPGKIIGTGTLLNAGETKEVYVKATIVSGKEYFAMLHTDNGDGFFNIAKDSPTTDADGNIVMMKFSVTK
ncbi:MAG: hypothetical protein RDU25_04245 [Patescibacteria group bacterium]|nr:hypothetical protein [Patescibacteria group bacterium]